MSNQNQNQNPVRKRLQKRLIHHRHRRLAWERERSTNKCGFAHLATSTIGKIGKIGKIDKMIRSDEIRLSRICD